MPDDTSTPEAAPEIPVEVGEVNPQPPPAEAKIPTADDRIAALEKDKKELNDRFLRTAADFDNYRKRARKDVDDARGKAKEDVLREMLPVVDNLERALAAAESAGGPSATGGIADGVKLVLRQFGSALDRFEVKSFNTVGQPFDPARHEAIAQVESADQPAGTVVNEMQKGYLIGSKLLRPAMVAVAKAPPQPAEPPRARQTIPPTAPAEAPTLTGLPDDDEEGFAGPDEKTKAGATIPPGSKE
jgi:molecular chaperone GrpE